MKYFGTDGIRGTYGDREISEPFFNALGRAAAGFLSDRLGGGKIVVGGDTRASTDALKKAFCSGLAEGGAQFEDVGVLPTPALAYCVTFKGAKMGAITFPISANKLCVLSVTTFSLVSNVCKIQMIIVATKMTVKAFCIKSFALSHIKSMTLFKDGNL